MVDRGEPPFEGGAQPVRERPPEVATRGRTVILAIVFVLAILILIGAVLWVAAPLAR